MIVVMMIRVILQARDYYDTASNITVIITARVVIVILILMIRTILIIKMIMT